jgi:hypothetical protein
MDALSSRLHHFQSFDEGYLGRWMFPLCLIWICLRFDRALSSTKYIAAQLRHTLRVMLITSLTSTLRTSCWPCPSCTATLSIQACSFTRRLLRCWLRGGARITTSRITARTTRARKRRGSRNLVARWVGLTFGIVNADYDAWVVGCVGTWEAHKVGALISSATCHADLSALRASQYGLYVLEQEWMTYFHIELRTAYDMVNCCP